MKIWLTDQEGRMDEFYEQLKDVVNIKKEILDDTEVFYILYADDPEVLLTIIDTVEYNVYLSRISTGLSIFDEYFINNDIKMVATIVNGYPEDL